MCIIEEHAFGTDSDKKTFPCNIYIYVHFIYVNFVQCVLCLTEECSYKDDYYFLLTDGGTEAGNCTKLAHKDPSFHISGNNGTCDQCDSHYLLKKKYNYDCQPTDWTKVNGYQSCKLRGRHNGAEVTYAIRVPQNRHFEMSIL